jgi:hypothetical protein
MTFVVLLDTMIGFRRVFPHRPSRPLQQSGNYRIDSFRVSSWRQRRQDSLHETKFGKLSFLESWFCSIGIYAHYATCVRCRLQSCSRHVNWSIQGDANLYVCCP